MRWNNDSWEAEEWVQRYPVKAVKCAPGGNLYEVRDLRGSLFCHYLLPLSLSLALALSFSSRVYPLSCCSRSRAAPKPFCCVMFVRVAAAACLMHATHAVVFIDTQASSLPPFLSPALPFLSCSSLILSSSLSLPLSPSPTAFCSVSLAAHSALTAFNN